MEEAGKSSRQLQLPVQVHHLEQQEEEHLPCACGKRRMGRESDPSRWRSAQEGWPDLGRAPATMGTARESWYRLRQLAERVWE